MKVDGKEIAKANLARRSQNEKDAKETEQSSEKAIVDRGSHIAQMASLIEAIHSKDPDAAHKHMMEYAASASKK